MSNNVNTTLPQEPKQKSGDNTSVLIIRQITPFGAADLEGHLSLGERIMSVNGEPITDHTIEDIVGMIKPCNVLQLKVCKTGLQLQLLTMLISQLKSSQLRGQGGVFLKFLSKLILWVFLIEGSNIYLLLLVLRKNIVPSRSYRRSKVSAHV